MAKIKESQNSQWKNAVIRLSKYVKVKTLSSLLFKWKIRLLLAIFWHFWTNKTGCGHRLKGQNQNLRKPITEPSIVVYWNYKKFGPTTLQVWLLFLVPHPRFWKVYARFPDEEFNTESIGTNLNPKNEKQKSLYALFYFLFFILFWGHFNKTMLFPFFLTIWESVRSRKITQFKQKKCSWIIFKGKGFRAERKNMLCYYT